MSSEVLREAARLMRERAEARAAFEGAVERINWEPPAPFPMEPTPAAMHHNAWHPAVALAVADSLEEAADAFDNHMAKQMDPLRRFHGLWLAEAERKHERALAVARAYLNEVPS